MKHFIGLDVSVKETSVCIVDETGKICQLFFHPYGTNGVTPRNPPATLPGEIGIAVECIAPSADRALDVLRTTKQYLLHYGYEGRLSTAGNLAFPFTPPEIRVGPAYEFSVYHLMDVEAQSDVFTITTEDL